MGRYVIGCFNYPRLVLESSKILPYTNS